MKAPPPAGYRLSAPPPVAIPLAARAGPSVARWRFGPAFAVAVGGLVIILGASARLMSDTTVERVIGSPLFSVVHTLSVLGLVGVATLAFVATTLLTEKRPRLAITGGDLTLTRAEGELVARVERMVCAPVRIEGAGGAREGLELRFPSGEVVRIAAGDEPRVEGGEPWDYAATPDELDDLSRRIGRG